MGNLDDDPASQKPLAPVEGRPADQSAAIESRDGAAPDRRLSPLASSPSVVPGSAAPGSEPVPEHRAAPRPPNVPRTLDAEIGPFYDTAAVQTLIGDTSSRAVEDRRAKHSVVAVKTIDGRWAYPTFQFVGNDVDPALVPAIQALRDGPGWAAAMWFVTPNPDLDDATPLEWARQGHPPDRLVTSARRTARAWR